MDIPPRVENLIGKRFDRLIVVSYNRKEKGRCGNTISWWNCVCDCGNEKIVRGYALKRGQVRSCGCLRDEINIRREKQNKYVEVDDYIIGYTSKNEVFYFDSCDLDILKNYCWHISQGYVVTKYMGKRLRMHNLIINPIPLGMTIDHINRNRSDNRRNNLRLATSLENAANISLPKNNSTGYIGVHKIKNKERWEVSIRHNNIIMYLGSFYTLEDAIIARLKAEKEYFGEFASQRHLFEEYGIE